MVILKLIMREKLRNVKLMEEKLRRSRVNREWENYQVGWLVKSDHDQGFWDHLVTRVKTLWSYGTIMHCVILVSRVVWSHYPSLSLLSMSGFLWCTLFNLMHFTNNSENKSAALLLNKWHCTTYALIQSEMQPQTYYPTCRCNTLN